MYRSDLNFPRHLKLKEGVVNLVYTSHALERFKERSKDVVLPTWVNIKKEIVVRSYTKDDKNVDTCLVRLNYDENLYLFLLLDNIGNVKTLWFKYKNQYTRKITILKNETK